MRMLGPHHAISYVIGMNQNNGWQAAERKNTND
jgi:hypothetical protein